MNTKGETRPPTKHVQPTQLASASLLTGGWVVLQPEVDVLLDTKAKASSVGEVLALELVLFHLESSLEDLQRLVTAHLRTPDARTNRKTKQRRTSTVDSEYHFTAWTRSISRPTRSKGVEELFLPLQSRHTTNMIARLLGRGHQPC